MNDGGTPNFEQDPFSFRRPAWGEWKFVERARLWEAVSLACDLDPSNFTLFKNPRLDRFFKHPPQQLEDLLLLAKGNIAANDILKLVSKSNEGLEEREVQLSNFVTWLKSIEHQIPTEFPWQDEPITPIKHGWPWGKHETALLRKLADAANHFWSLYDPSDPSTAPTNKQVVKWLVTQGVAERNATVMATILRADGLQFGPRK